MPVDAESLPQALGLLRRIEREPGVRELVALSLSVDGWFVFQDALPGPADSRVGQDPPGEMLGHRLPDVEGLPSAWILPGGRLLEQRGDLDAPAEPTELAEVEDRFPELADRLRRALIDQYLGDVDVSGLPEGLLQRTVTVIGGIIRRVDSRSRSLLLEHLRREMDSDGARWESSAVRLRAIFEHAVGTSNAAVLDQAVPGLVQLATRGPFPPPEAGDPAHLLNVLFRMPRPEVHRRVLEALAESPAPLAAEVRERIAPFVRDALTSTHAEVRRAAGELELLLARAEAGDAAPPDGRLEEIAAIVSDLSNPVAYRRRDALERIEGRAGEMPAVLPHLLDALTDGDPEVRIAALTQVRPLLGAKQAAVRERAFAALLRAEDPRLVSDGVARLGKPPFPIDHTCAMDLLNAALDGPSESRRAAAVRMAEWAAHRPPAEAVEVYGRLLRHHASEVRMVGLRQIGRDAVDRVNVREQLTHDLMAHLRDPDPSIRIETARTLLAVGHPGGARIVSRLATDPEPAVRHAVLGLIESELGADELASARQMAHDVERLLAVAAGGDGDERIAWSRSLERIIERDPARAATVLVAALKRLDPGTTDPFRRFAIGELDRGLRDLVAAGHISEGLVGLCRRLMEPPDTRPAHAARLAAADAASDPQLFDVLWTMVTSADGTAEVAARREVSALIGRRKSDDVREMIAELRAAEQDPARRDVLRALKER